MSDRGADPRRDRAWPDLAAGLAVLAFGGLAFWQALVIPVSPIYAQVGPKAVPFVVAGGLVLLGAGLVAEALRGGWSHGLEEMQDAPPANRRAFALLLPLLGSVVSSAGLFTGAALLLGAPRPARVVAYGWTLAAWFLFVEMLGVNIGAGVLEGLVLRALGREAPA